MALTFKFDPDQLQSLINSIDNLSNNLAKWQANQTTAIEQGFANLVTVLGGDLGEDVQERIDQSTNMVKAVKDKLQTSIDSQKGE